MLKRLTGAAAMAVLMVTAAAAKDVTTTIPVGPYKVTLAVVQGNDEDYGSMFFLTSKELGGLNVSGYTVLEALNSYESLMKKKGFATGWESIDNTLQASAPVVEAKRTATGWAVKLKGFGSTVFQVDDAVLSYGSVTPAKPNNAAFVAITFMVLPDGTDFVVMYEDGMFGPTSTTEE